MEQYDQRGLSITDETNDFAVLISAARSDQLAADARFEGQFFGALTFHLTNLLRSTDGNLSYAALLDQLRARLQAENFDQIPQLEGSAANKTRPFLTRTGSVVAPSPASSTATRRSTPPPETAPPPVPAAAPPTPTIQETAMPVPEKASEEKTMNIETKELNIAGITLSLQIEGKARLHLNITTVPQAQPVTQETAVPAPPPAPALPATEAVPPVSTSESQSLKQPSMVGDEATRDLPPEFFEGLLPHEDEDDIGSTPVGAVSSSTLGRGMKAEQFTEYVRTYNFGSRPPTFVVIHHTAIPDTRQARAQHATWDSNEDGLSEQQIYAKRLRQLTGIKSYYQNSLRWDRGPHLFIDERWIWLFTPMYIRASTPPRATAMGRGQLFDRH
ncbi:MAG: caspase family protein [Blastochloris sp.]|nr:caspase family protein [Blastochloris sp.]